MRHEKKGGETCRPSLAAQLSRASSTPASCLAPVLTVDFALLDLRAGQRLLDLGCGQGRHALVASQRVACQVAAVDQMDLSWPRKVFRLVRNVEGLPGDVSFLRGDALRLPFRARAFERVVCAEVLEHVASAEAATAELARMLAPGGRLAVTVPTAGPEYLYRRVQPRWVALSGHVRVFRLPDLFALLRGAGLQVYALRFKHGLHTPYWLLRCLDERAFPTRAYGKLLEWLIWRRSPTWERIESLGDYVCPKSVAVYAWKSG